MMDGFKIGDIVFTGNSNQLKEVLVVSNRVNTKFLGLSKRDEVLVVDYPVTESYSIYPFWVGVENVWRTKADAINAKIENLKNQLTQLEKRGTHDGI
jgi:hypothetical protein